MNKLARYLRHHVDVPGWLDSYSAQFISEISTIQNRARFTGSVGEIGVHMGRLFILLKLLAGPTERAVAIDVFHYQHLNVDKSGEGDERQFRKNVDRWASGDNLEVIQRSSLDVRASDVIARVGKCRIFSIDGGHSAECTMNDLHLAEQIIETFGVVILDDYFNPSWPDVSIGAARYMDNPLTVLRPFAITPNKLFLAHPAFHSLYRSTLRISQNDYFEKDSYMRGFQVHTFGVDPDTYTASKKIKRWLKRTPAGPRLVAANRLMRCALGRPA